MELAKQLIGQSVSDIGRAADMLCIPIGEIVKTGYKGCGLSRYEIHCQCAWRLLDPINRIIVASTDVYLPPSSIEWSESFRWYEKEGNLFDEKIAEFNDRHRNCCITNIEITKCHDLIVEFDNSITFEAFVDSSTEESWRIIQRGPNSVHLVCTGNLLRIE